MVPTINYILYISRDHPCLKYLHQAREELTDTSMSLVSKVFKRGSGCIVVSLIFKKKILNMIKIFNLLFTLQHKHQGYEC